VGEGANTAPAGKRTQSIVSNTIIRGVAQGVSVIASFVLLPFLVRAFTLGDYGVFMLAAAVTSYAALLDFGVGNTLIRLVADRLARHEDNRVGAVVASAGLFYAGVGVLAAILMAGIAVFGGSLFAVQPAQANLLRQLLLIGAAVQLVYWPASAAAHALAGYERYDLLSGVSMVQTVAGVLAIVAVLVLRLGPVALALINAGITLVVSLANLVLLARVASVRMGSLRPQYALVVEVIRGGLPLFALQMSALLGRQTTDRIILGVFLGAEAVGIYEVAAKLCLLVTQASDLLSGAILPVASNMNAREHVDSLRALFIRGARYAVVAIAPIVVVLVFIAGPFIRAWFGASMNSAVPVAQVLLAAQLLIPLYLIGDPILIGMNRFSRWVGGAFSVAVLNVVLSIVFVKAFGLVGVAVATLVANLVEFPLYARLATRELDITLWAWLKEASFPGYVLLIVPAAVALVGGASVLGGSLLTLLVVALAALLSYWGLAWSLALPGWEREELVGVVRAMLRRSEPAE